jgi:hypothetical protein
LASVKHGRTERRSKKSDRKKRTVPRAQTGPQKKEKKMLDKPTKATRSRALRIQSGEKTSIVECAPMVPFQSIWSLRMELLVAFVGLSSIFFSFF